LLPPDPAGGKDIWGEEVKQSRGKVLERGAVIFFRKEDIREAATFGGEDGLLSADVAGRLSGAPKHQSKDREVPGNCMSLGLT